MDEHELETLDRVHTAPEPDDPRKPRHYWQLKYRYWVHALRRAGAGFWRHNTLDSAAALTFFSVLSFVPALLALVALLTQVGQGQATTAWIMSLLERAAPEDVVTLLEQPIARLTQVSGAGYVAVVSVTLAIWSASTYVAAFGRAMNGLYEVAEGRPLWKIIPYNLLLTVLMLLYGAVTVLAALATDDLMRFVATELGLPDNGLAIVTQTRWLVLLAAALIWISALYFTTPNVRLGRYHVVTIGTIVAVGIMSLAVMGFSWWVSNFGQFNVLYGAIGSFVVLLMGLWFMNMALLFGAELDAELERARELQAGMEAEEYILLPPRDDRVIRRTQERRDRIIRQAARLRKISQRTGAASGSDGSE